jgi:hypothetical protein
VLLILFMFEVFLNGFFLAKGNELGYLGGASEALTFALLNIGVAFLIAVVGVREINHRNPFRKLAGVLALAVYIALLFIINLSLAHYREVSAAMLSDAGREVLSRLQTAPLALVDFKSWLLFGLGVLCSLIAFVDSFLIFDPYPGYASVEKRRAGAHDAYIRRKSELIERLLEIRDEAIEILEEANRDLSIRRSEHDSILESRARIVRLFAAYQTHLDRAVNALLSIYREANRGLRKTPPPQRFSVSYALDKIPVEPELADTSSREELRRAIAESQGLLAGQIEAIHGEFEQAFASYREIDNFVEEDAVVAASAQAA